MGSMELSLVIGGAATAIVIAIVMTLRDALGGKSTVDDRLDLVAGRRPNKTDSPDNLELFTENKSAWNQYFGWLPRPGGIDRLATQADVNLDTTGFVAVSFGLGVGGGLLGLFLTRSVVWTPVMAISLGSMPLLWLMVKRKKRFKKIGGQLPDALDLVGRALRAGHSLAAGLGVVAEEMPDPIARELGRVYEEQNLGIPLEEALDALTERVPNLDVRFFVTAVLIQRQTGGDLAELLDKISYVIRERFKVYGQVQALTAEGRLSGVVLLVLPLLVFVGVWNINRPYLEMLFIEPMGRTMLAVAVILQVIGALVIRKIVNIRV